MSEGFPRPHKSQTPEGSKLPVTLAQLFSETPVQGIGYQRFTERERNDVEALLSKNGVTESHPALSGISGDTIADIQEYVKTPPSSPTRAVLAARISQGIEKAITQDRDADTYGSMKKAA